MSKASSNTSPSMTGPGCVSFPEKEVSPVEEGFLISPLQTGYAMLCLGELPQISPALWQHHAWDPARKELLVELLTLEHSPNLG